MFCEWRVIPFTVSGKGNKTTMDQLRRSSRLVLTLVAPTELYSTIFSQTLEPCGV